MTITITKQCGGTPVSFASVLFNYEHNNNKSEMHVVSFYVPICRVCGNMMASWRSWWLHLSHWWCWTIWVTCIASCTLFKPYLESIRTFLLLLFFSSVADFCFLFISFLIWWSPPFKGGFLSIWKRCTRWSGWLYHCDVFLYPHSP